MKTVRVAKQFDLSRQDFLRGLIIAVLSPVFTIVIESINAGILIFNWRSMALTGLSAGLAYLLKNWSEPTKVISK